jgi:hypothetical protein
MTIGTVAAAAFTMAAEALLKGSIGLATKDAYNLLKKRISKWAGHDLDAAERSPSSPARSAVLAEAIDSLANGEQRVIKNLAAKLIDEMEKDPKLATIGLKIGQLKASTVSLGTLSVSGPGSRGIVVDEVDVSGNFALRELNVRNNSGKRTR